MHTVLMFAPLVSALSLSAMNSTSLDKPDFVFAVLATHRARPEMLEKASMQNILAYVINWESSVDIDKSVIRNAWQYSQGKWIRVAEMPLPNVVYDFGTYKHSRERKEAARLLKAQLHEMNVLFINPDIKMDVVNDKILFSKILQKNNINHPETREYTRSNLNKMLDKHDLLFIKPTFGSKGFGIIVVKKTIEKGVVTFTITHKIKRGGKWETKRRDVHTKRKVRKAIAEAKDNFKRKNARYLIQQGVNVHIVNDKRTDFRVNVQRGAGGVVYGSGLFMRVGGNMSQGGRAADYRDVLKSFDEEGKTTAESIKQDAVDTAIRTHLVLEKQVGAPIGELGVDLVVNQHGEVFVIEANGKSGYVRNYVRDNPHVDSLYGLPKFYQGCIAVDQAHENGILAYARYLAQAEK